jgi:mannose-6-phosphate isomerase
MNEAKTLLLEGGKTTILDSAEKHLTAQGLKIVAKDFNRPWGGFFVLDEAQAEKFGALYFPGIDVASLKVEGGKLSPKILMVETNKRLSWQYHHRRSEIWKLAAGTAGVVTSQTDQQGQVKRLTVGEVIRLHKGLRHRLVGLEGWGMVAEIWQHTDPAKPSDEEDIVRVQDDFGR